ncbi:MAG: MCE family protein [Nitrospinae bacterium]|nr:MCE family protein [Nitrospinota bacterium]
MMHYIHTLTAGQKKLVIWGFVATPLAVLALMTVLWAHNKGMFKRMVMLRTVVHSAQGIDNQTLVTFSGFVIGNVTDVSLSAQDAIEVTFRVDGELAKWIHNDAAITLASVNLIGSKEMKITGGTPDAPLVKDGDLLPAVEGVDMGNLMDRVSPIIVTVEKMVARLDQILEHFPDDKMNESVHSLSGILSDIKGGKATVGKLVSTDNGALYNKLDKLVAKLNDISEKVDEASKHLPETMENTAEITRNARTMSKDLPEMQKTFHQVLKNLDRILNDIAAMTPAINKTITHAGTIAQDVSKISPRLPALMDDVEQTLNETMIMVKSLKRSWPVKNMVPKEKEKVLFGSARRESPYAAAPQTVFGAAGRETGRP